MPKDLIDTPVFPSPVVVPVDTDARNAASVETPFQTLTNRTAFLKDELEGLQAEVIHNPRRTRVIAIPASAFIFHRTYDPNDPGFDIYQNEWLMKVGNGVLRDGELFANEALAECFVNLGPYMPSGSRLESVFATVEPGSSRSSGDRLQLEVYKTTYLGGRTTTLLASVEDDGTTTEQSLDLDGIDEEIDWSNSQVTIHVRAGNPANDLFSFVWVSFLDPGPRNY